MSTFARRAEPIGVGLARIVSLIATVVVALIVVGIVLILLEANRANAIVDWLVNAGEFLAGPFDDFFTPDGYKTQIVVNWGLAAVVYAFVGGLIVRLLGRSGT
jgi:hypothetical protein